MLFFGRRKIILVICILLTMAVTGWFWRHKESVPFVSQTLSTAAAPFEYTASQITFMGKTGISIIDQSVSKWSDLDNLRKEKHFVFTLLTPVTLTANTALQVRANTTARER